MRLYESCGARTTAEVAFAMSGARLREVTLLEEELPDGDPVALDDAGTISVPLKPFDIRTFRMH